MRLHRAWSAAVVLASLPLGCADDRLSGNSSETENTASRMVRLDSLLARRDPSDTFATVATLRLDSTHLPFAQLDSLGRDLALERPDGTPLPFERIYWDRERKIARLRVRLSGPILSRGGWFLLRWGTPFQGWMDPLSVWKGIDELTRLSLTSFVVDDFESGRSTSRLPESPSWYSSASDSATVSPLSFPQAGRGRSGLAASITYSANRTAGRYSLIGLKLGTKARNLRSLDSVVLYARGSGLLGIALERPDGVHGTKAWCRLELDTAWKRIRVAPGDFEGADGNGGNVGWMAIRDSVTHLTFLVGGGSELWVDDIRLHGVDVDDFR